MNELNHFINSKIITVGEDTIKVYNVLLALVFFISTKFIVWLVSRIIENRKKRLELDHSNIYALKQISIYILWIIGISFMLNSLGIKITFLLAGSAALLVGVGLGLQQTFNDFISGIILLFEGTTKIGDILEIDNDMIKIKGIGLRTSKAIDRFNISVIIPNSLITSSKVVNWSHLGATTLFTIKVGVAYGSDVEKVIKVLKQSAEIHPEVVRRKEIEVRFSDFGASSLDFTLLFYVNNIFGIEKIKSEIRINIAKVFNENDISVPFNQLDVYLKNQ